MNVLGEQFAAADAVVAVAVALVSISLFRVIHISNM